MSDRPSASTPLRDRLPRALREFVLLPVLVVVALLILAALSILGDQAHGAFFTSVRHVLGHFIGAKTAASTLGAVATGLVTVTSITFSVLLLAVQQTASNLSPVVFDQFVRRRANQAYLGLFVGLALFSYVVLAAVQKETPPIIGAFIATVLTVVALSCLLFLVYSTIDQMRPDNVIRQLHDRAAMAHERESGLVARTRRAPTSSGAVQAEHRCDTFGYVQSIHLHRLETAVREVPDDLEVTICVSVGQAVTVGDVLAQVRGGDPERAGEVCSAVGEAMRISPTADIDYDPRTALHNLGNITWSSGSTSKHNPTVAAKGLHALRDLAARWLAEGDRSQADPLPVVYPDTDVAVVLDAIYAGIVVAHESHQYQEAVHVLDAYAGLWPRARGAARQQMMVDLRTMRPLLEQLPPSARLDAAGRRLWAAVGTSGPH